MNALAPYLLIMIAGAGAIVSQITWQRYVARLVGQSSVTIAAVIGMSLLGLALGNWWGGSRRRTTRSRRLGPVRFACAMLATEGFLLVSLPYLFRLAGWPEAPWGNGGAMTGVLRFVWILLLATPVLLTHFFAGAILPGLLRQRGADASAAGWLAALETLGGCVGALATGCLMLELWGMDATAWRCGGFTLAVSLVAFNAAGRSQSSLRGNSGTPVRALLKSNLTLWFGVLLAGVASLGLEISWQRLAILIVGTDGYSLTILITAYLIGISAGAALAACFLKRARLASSAIWRSRVAVLQLLGGLVSLLVLTAIVQLASGAGQAWLAAPATVIGIDVSPLAKRFLLCLALFVVPASFQGASWPLLVQSLSGDVASHRKPPNVSAIAAAIYAVVALGNVLGVLCAGFVLIPWRGVQLTVVSLVGVCVVASWMIASVEGVRTRAVISVAVVGLCLLRIVTWSPVGLSIDDRTTRLLYYREGPKNTVAVTAAKQHPDLRQMVVDGVVIGQSGGNVEEKQLMLAHLPAMLRHGQRPVRNAVVIGLGSGMLSRELASIEGVEHVTTVEISPSVIQASHLFDDLGPTPTAQMSVVAADGFGWLSRQTRRFDAIVSDGKSRPGHVGNSMFFSLDYYWTVLRRLTPEGVFVQWISLDSEVRETETVIKTFTTMFPYARIAIAAPGSIYLVGSRHPIQLSEKSVDSYLRSPKARGLRRYFWRDADDIRSMGWLQISGDAFSRLQRDRLGRPRMFHVNTLDRPLLERISFDNRPEALQRNRIANVDLLLNLLEQRDVQTGIFDAGNAGDRLAVVGMLRAARAQIFAKRGWLEAAAVQMRGAIERLPSLSRGGFLSRAFGQLAGQERAIAGQSSGTREIKYLKQSAALLPGDYSLQMSVAGRLMLFRRFDEALGFYQQAVRIRPGDVIANRGVAAALTGMGKPEQANRVLREAGLESAAAATPSPVLAEAEPGGKPSDPSDATPRTDQQRVDRLRELLQE